MNILYAVLVLGIMGAVFGLVLAVASKVFAVKTDARLEPIQEALPGANCGGCGYSGCAGYAQAIIDGKAKIGLCAAGGNEAALKISKIMGVQAEVMERKVAMVKCRGTEASVKARYDGLSDCAAATKVAGNGPKECSYGCLGFGNCVKVCQYGAMHIVNGIARVDHEKCVGCMACAAACPRHIIAEVPYEADIVVACASQEKGAVLRKFCNIGCIGCKICEKTCQHDAIHVKDNLASIDYSKCVSCGECAEKCPRNLISDANLKREFDTAASKAR